MAVPEGAMNFGAGRRNRGRLARIDGTARKARTERSEKVNKTETNKRRGKWVVDGVELGFWSGNKGSSRGLCGS